MDFSNIMDFASSSGGDSNPWSYWAKAIQDAVIGQSAGFDAVKQNEESSPLAIQARGGETSTNNGLRGEYKYNFEGQVPFLQGIYSSFANRKEDPLYKQSVDAITKSAQNNASGSNASLDTSLNKDARKIAGISEGGATPQLNKDTSFNSMMDAYENLSLPMDNPKNRKNGMTGLDILGKMGDNNFDFSTFDWQDWVNMFGGS